ncbi:MAG: PQQ-dependent sugar dehydrogenase [Acidobacteriota bacterium]|nr:PQQ-dependent sugar dehydrogenase [Acidobacteriota bacterium]
MKSLLVFFFATAALAQPELNLVPIAVALDRPVGIANAGDSRLFIVEKTGQIVIYDGTRVLPAPFLDVHTQLSPDSGEDGEHGLLGLAFDPANPRFFYVDYTNFIGDITIERYAVSDDPNSADPNSGTLVLRIPHPGSVRHNGGQLQFGRDGYLYISVGDGGMTGDPDANAQNPSVLLGKILRIDVRTLPYTIPPSNPFNNEVWAFGLRNPWRFSFDRITGDMWIADVGQNDWEEVDFQPAGSVGGQNYGWHMMEGDHCFNPPEDCEQASFVMPVIEYGHIAGACSITGGYRYRGPRFPRLVGIYFYGDFCTGTIFGATEQSDGQWDSQPLRTTRLAITSFGEDQDGELYVADFHGAVFHITDSVVAQPRRRSVAK